MHRGWGVWIGIGEAGLGCPDDWIVPFVTPQFREGTCAPPSGQVPTLNEGRNRFAVFTNGAGAIGVSATRSYCFSETSSSLGEPSLNGSAANEEWALTGSRPASLSNPASSWYV